MENQELLEKHKKTLQETNKTLTETEKDIKEMVELGKEAANNLVSYKSHLNQEIQAVELLNPDKIKSLGNDYISLYSQHLDMAENNLKNLQVFKGEISAPKNFMKYAVGTTEVLDSTSSVTVWNLGTILKGIPDPAFQEQLDKIDTQPSIDKDLKYVELEITNLDNFIGEKFSNLIRDWNAASTNFHTHLLTLRSIIFDQLFDQICPDSKLSRSPWHGSPSRNKRFCQVKYFMQGINEDLVIPPADLNLINNIASDLEQNFNKLSNLGKKDGIYSQVQNTFVQTVSNLANAFRMRKKHFKDIP